MKNLDQIATITTAAICCAALLLAQGQAPQDEKSKQARAQNIARAFELNARTITLFDRQGKQLNRVGSRGMYGATVFSPTPDGSRCLRPT